MAQPDSKQVQVVEENIYFPAAAVNQEYLQDGTTHSACPLKGRASYYDLLVDGKVNHDAAWF